MRSHERTIDSLRTCMESAAKTQRSRGSELPMIGRRTLEGWIALCRRALNESRSLRSEAGEGQG